MGSHDVVRIDLRRIRHLLFGLYLLVPCAIIEAAKVRPTLVARVDIFHDQLWNTSRLQILYGILILVNSNPLHRGVCFQYLHDFVLQLVSQADASIYLLCCGSAY